MIVSHEYKFIFMKTRRTAGTSIEISLSRYLGPRDVITRQINDAVFELQKEWGVESRNYHYALRNHSKRQLLRRLLGGRRLEYNPHTSATLVKHHFPEEWRSYYKFCVERNPYEKVISGYYTHLYLLEAGAVAERYDDLGDYIRRAPLWSDLAFYQIDGRTEVDFIARYENLQTDLQGVCDHLGIPWDGALPRARADYRTDQRSHREILAPEDRRIIREKFRTEFECLGYEMD